MATRQSRLAALAEQVAAHLEESGVKGGGIAKPFAPLMLLRRVESTTFEALLYEPVVCLILQGEKETSIGSRTLRVGAGKSLVVSHDVLVSSRITRATPRSPYLALILTLDLAMLRSLYSEIGDVDLEQEHAHSIEINDADDALIDALGRYLALADKPLEASVLEPLILREIHFRLLVASNGGMLRRLLERNSHASSIARAIERLRRDFHTPIAVAELARVAGMSASSFHKHFRAVTETTPLQYQKDLRLIEARRLLGEGGRSVSTVAFDVGYESPTQFSREYARKFGASPRDHLPRDGGGRAHRDETPQASA